MECYSTPTKRRRNQKGTNGKLKNLLVVTQRDAAVDGTILTLVSVVRLAENQCSSATMDAFI